MMRLVAEVVLGLTWQCYTDPLDLNPDLCPADPMQLLTTRGRIFGFYPDGFNAMDTFANYSQDLPYHIEPEFQWRIGSSMPNPRSPNDLLFGSESVLNEVAERREELLSETNYSKAMQIADEIIAKAVNGGMYKGIPYHELSVWQVAIDQNYTAEELRLYLDLSGPVTPYTLHTHLERLITLVVREAALEKINIGGYKGLVTPVAMRGGVRRRIGMSALVDGLLERSVAAGVQVFYNRRVVRVRRVSRNSQDMYVILANGQRVKTSKVIMNVGKTDLTSFGLQSEPISSASDSTRVAFSRILSLPGTKAYCFWDDAWWLSKLNRTSGFFRLADETLYQGRYHDGDVVCGDIFNFSTCRGALLVSYASGSINSGSPVSTIRSYNQRPYTPLVETDAMIKLIRGNMTKHQQLLYEDIHRQLRKAHTSSFEAFGADAETGVPNARGCLVSDWRDYGHQVDIGAGRGINDNELFTKPVPDLNISLVNEGWCEFRGWAEGSFISAERALYHVYGLQKPTWMDPYFHSSVIQRYNRG